MKWILIAAYLSHGTIVQRILPTAEAFSSITECETKAETVSQLTTSENIVLRCEAITPSMSATFHTVHGNWH